MPNPMRYRNPGPDLFTPFFYGGSTLIAFMIGAVFLLIVASVVNRVGFQGSHIETAKKGSAEYMKGMNLPLDGITCSPDLQQDSVNCSVQSNGKIIPLQCSNWTGMCSLFVPRPYSGFRDDD